MADPAFHAVSNTPACQICKSHKASHFCKCTDSATFFCLDCCNHHNAKYPFAFHQVLPIAALRQNPEEYMRKYEKLTKAAAEIHRNVDRMEQCSTEFEEAIQNCINYLTEYRSRWLHQLQTDKGELLSAINTAVQEVTACLSQGVEPVSALAQAMWRLAPEELRVFVYEEDVSDFPTLLQSWAHYENHLKSLCRRFHKRPKEQHSPRQLFPAIAGGIVELYDFNTHKTAQHILPTMVLSGYVQVDRDKSTVLIVGEEVRTLDLLTLHITPLASLLTPRNYVGVAQVGETVFAFGGSVGEGSMAVCENACYHSHTGLHSLQCTPLGKDSLLVLSKPSFTWLPQLLLIE